MYVLHEMRPIGKLPIENGQSVCIFPTLIIKVLSTVATSSLTIATYRSMYVSSVLPTQMFDSTNVAILRKYHGLLQGPTGLAEGL